ncbi:hypothetical protein ACEWY4_009650 [Coilia grayii]|uniref:Cytochrome P450 n=1 Tax=Coilia grayii TaxID=363190 RepID=A0ABD1K703_9TELE
MNVSTMILTAVLNWCDTKIGLLLLFTLLLLISSQKKRNRINFPPGPWVIPVLQDVLTGFDHHAVDKVAEKYGHIFSIWRRGVKIVYVSGFEMVHEVLVTQGDNFLDRPVSSLYNEAFKGNGISVSNGYRWRRQRHFSVSHMNSFGGGRRTMELNILQECGRLCGAIQEDIGCAFDPQTKINHSVANVIGFLMFGKHFSNNSADFQALLNLSAESVSLVHTPLAQLYDICPWIMRRLPGPHEIILSNYSKLAASLRKQIEIHKKDWDPFHHRDFVDSYIGEIDKRRKDTEAGFRVENLVYCTLDMFEAGTETVTSTLRWALLNMIKYPVVQEEVHAEIDRVVGRSRQPCLADRVNMPYTNAVLHETQRAGNILPMNTPRVAHRDTTLGGYLIPEGTMVITSLSSVLCDKCKWETPDQFNPNHFLDSQGSFRKREAFFAFSAGKRKCLGEHLAQMELFLFFTSLLQRFAFSSPGGPEPSLEAQGMAVRSPKPFQVWAFPR